MKIQFYFVATLLLLFTKAGVAQFDIPEPVVNTGVYAITDTVYMAPDGDDANPGTFSEPVKSFNVALQKLPFGVEGVNNGNAYGLIMMKPGFYETHNGFHQSASNFQNGNTFKHVSLEGIGEVVIGGTVDSFAIGHLFRLVGNHIFIKNIQLRYSHGIGLLLGRPTTLPERQTNVLIENVRVDSVGSFSMLIRRVDTVLVRNSASLYSSRPYNDNLVTPCQWPSGIKFLDSRDCIIHDSEIAYSRGEGLNFHNSERGLAYNNRLHNNPLNFYNDNSAKLIVRNNHIYNTPGIDEAYWRTCPADTQPVFSGTGLMIANEGACNQGNAPVFDNCMTQCILPNEFIRNVDSMFIYNNIFQNTGKSITFWQGVTDIAGANCVRNVFIFNNTFMGNLGSPDASNAGVVDIFYPSYNAAFNSFYGTLENVHITHNIIAYDTAYYTNLSPVRKVFHNFHPGPLDINFDYNLWVKNHPDVGQNGLVRNELPAELPLLNDTLYSITPCQENAAFIYATETAFPFLTKDYLNRERTTGFTNVGAIEFDEDCNRVYSTIHPKAVDQSALTVYPNPCVNCTYMQIEGLPADRVFEYQLYSIEGKLLSTGKLIKNQFLVPENLKGIFIITISDDAFFGVSKVVLQK